MLIIEGSRAMSGYKPGTARVTADANTHTGVVELSVWIDADGKWTPGIKHVSGHNFVREFDGHQYLSILRKSLVTIKLPAGSSYWLTKGDFFRLVNEAFAEKYSLEYDETEARVTEFVLHAHSTYVSREDAGETERHPFNVQIGGLPGGREAAEIGRAHV